MQWLEAEFLGEVGFVTVLIQAFLVSNAIFHPILKATTEVEYRPTCQAGSQQEALNTSSNCFRRHGSAPHISHVFAWGDQTRLD